MKRSIAGFYILLCIGHLIVELVAKSFSNGLEAFITIGITAIGIYLAWVVMTLVEPSDMIKNILDKF